MEKTNWKNVPKLHELKAEVTGAEYTNSAKDSRIIEYRREYQENTTPVPDSLPKGARAKSSYKSKLVEDEVLSASSELQYHVTNPIRLFNITATGEGQEDSAKEHSLLIHKQFDSIKSELADESSVNYAVDGTLCLKTGWRFVETTTTKVHPTMSESPEEALSFIKQLDSDKKKDKLIRMLKDTGTIPVGLTRINIAIVSENRPTVHAVDPTTLIVDPKAKTTKDIRFVVEVHETDYTTLINSKGSFINLKELKIHIKNSAYSDNTSYNEYDPRVDEDGLFEFSDMARKKFTVHEYWGYYDINNNNTLEPIVAMWVGSTLIRLEKSPYPFKGLPYDFASYYPISGSIWGFPIADRLKYEQRAKTGIVRAMQDITDIEAADQEFVDTSIFANDLQVANYMAGKNVLLKKGSDPARGIYKRNTSPVSATLFDQLQMYDNNTVNKTGNFNVDQMQVTGSATGAEEVMDGITFKKKAVIRRYLNIFESVGKKITQMNSAFILSDDTKYASHGRNNQGKLCKVNVDLLRDEVGVVIDVMTSRDADNKASKIITLMNTAVGGMSEDTALIHFKKIADLWGLYDISEHIDKEMEEKANYQPTEQEIELEKIEIERLKLENDRTRLKIMHETKQMENMDTIMLERLNKLEIGLEEANKYRIKSEGDLSQANASKYKAQSELFNQSFNLVEDGTTRNNEKIDAEYQHQANLEREQKRTDRELKVLELRYSNGNKSTDNTVKEVDPLIEYIRNGTLHNQSFDAADAVYRDILKVSPEHEAVKKNSASIIKEARNPDK